MELVHQQRRCGFMAVCCDEFVTKSRTIGRLPGDCILSLSKTRCRPTRVDRGQHNLNMRCGTVVLVDTRIRITSSEHRLILCIRASALRAQRQSP